MKQRFSSLDIKVIAHELSQTLTSLRVSNIYDLSSRIFLFKFAKPNHRAQLVVDSGFRCHLTSFARTTAGAPSAFVARLRKFLKTRRVTKVSQIGTDRILELQFSDGQYRLFLEFYAGGNIVLTDGELKILALHRTVSEGQPHERIKQGSDYNVEDRQNVKGVPPVSKERLMDGLQKWIERQAEYEAQAQSQQKKQGKKKADALKKALAATFNEFPPILLDHAIYVTKLDAARPPEDVLKDDEYLDRIMNALKEAQQVLSQMMRADPIRGYITGKSKPADGDAQTATNEDSAKNVLYNDFHPFKPQQLEDDATLTTVEFEGFNKTVDEFFSSIEGQKLESRLQEREAAAKRKMDNARQDQERRIGGLQAMQDLNIRKAQAIEANLQRVEEAIAAINSLIAQGYDWVDIDRLIETEQARRNPVAEMIKTPLKLNENTATLLLGEWEEDDDLEEDDEGYHTDSEPSGSEDEEDDEDPKPAKDAKSSKGKSKVEDKRLHIDIDLALSPWSNAREYYDQKRTAAAKQEKTVQASSKALKSAQHKIEADLKRGLKQEKAVLRAVRTPLWFEKFIYFVSSDGYLVIGGKDAQQDDTIYKRYLKKGDAYVHADLNGAASVIIKNNSATPDAPIPPSTLSQAGNLSVATSTAWDSKAVMSAWWVAAEQVSKIAPTGDVLGPGNFHIKGEKNFLPPVQLLLGFAIMWRISDASKARHFKHRVPQAPSDAPAIAQRSNAPSPEAQHSDEDDHSGEEDHDDAASDDEADGADAVDDASFPDQDTTTEHDPEAEDGEPADEQDEERHVYSNPLQSTAHSASDEDDTPHVEQLSLNGDTAKQEESEGSASDAESEAETHDTAPTQPTSTSNAKPGRQAAPQIRGKRGKKKKIAQKYANQDEEDRAAAMALLGSRAGQEKAAAEAAAKKEKQEQAEQAKARKREQALKAQEAARQREARKAAAAEQGEEDEEEVHEDAIIDLETLVPAPLPGDEILEAIPVSAPWSALGRYKYKVKIQPGSTKKGKATREILGKWNADAAKKGVVDPSGSDTERMWPREVELIKGWREEELFNVIPVGKVRVMMSGSGGGAGKDKKGGGGGGKGRGGKGGKKGR